MQNTVNQNKQGSLNYRNLRRLPILNSVTARLTVW